MRKSPTSTGSRCSTQQRVGKRRHRDRPAGFDNVQGVITAAYLIGSHGSDLGRTRGHEGLQGMDGEVPSDRLTSPTWAMSALHRGGS